MKKRRLYIGISVLIFILIAGLLGWSIFIGRQQQELKQGTEDLGYLGGGSGSSSSGGGLFGGIFGDSKNASSTGSINAPEPVLNQLYNLPMAGFIKKRSNAIRFVDRATGHIFEKELPNGSVKRVDQTTVPKVYEAYFVNDGDGVVRRYIDESGEIISVYNNLREDESVGTPLSLDILEVAVSPDGTNLSFIERARNGSNLMVVTPTGDIEKEILSSSLQGWNLEWKNNESILLTQKASGSLPGSSYVVDTDTGEKTLVLQQLPGLITNISPGGETILYSTIGDGQRPTLSVKHLDTERIVNLHVTGFASKCVWHPTSLKKIYCALPNELLRGVSSDDWHQGQVHFADSVWEIDTETANLTHILSPNKTGGVSLDMVDLTTDVSGGTIFFKNKTDQTLWSISLPEEQSSKEE